MMGVFPIGTLVALTTGEVGIVRDLNPETRFLLRPTVKIVAGADGNKIDGEIVDLTDKDPGTGRYLRTIASAPRPGQVRHRGRRLLPGRSGPAMTPRPPFRLRCEYLDEPLGVDTPSPRLAWLVESDVRGDSQKWCHILVSSAPRASPERHRRSLGHGPDRPARAARARLRRRAPAELRPLLTGRSAGGDGEGRPSPWSEPASFVTGFLAPGDWKPRWIAARRVREFRSKGTVLLGHQGADDTQACAVYLRREFALEERAALAMIFVSGLGHYELRLNGEQGRDERPRSRLDGLPEEGPLRLPRRHRPSSATGTPSGSSSATGGTPRPTATRRPRLTCRIEVEYESGERQILFSDESWRTSAGPLEENGLYFGERYRRPHPRRRLGPARIRRRGLGKGRLRSRATRWSPR
ncbi:MAG: alpha-L-rhamnosidase N-terminal domain-containing protein [Candidatus Moduliflexus flocculans]|nr:alpha-L-rhamnosidase N-terminal domain-containing protein [Candidatus Moduliflexus flocculans]